MKKKTNKSNSKLKISQKDQKKNTCNDKDSPLISKQKEIFNKFADKRLEEITAIDKKVNLGNLIYRYKSPIADVKNVIMLLIF